MTPRDLFLTLLVVLVCVWDANFTAICIALDEMLSSLQWLGCGLVVAGLLMATVHLAARSLLTHEKKLAMK